MFLTKALSFKVRSDRYFLRFGKILSRRFPTCERSIVMERGKQERSKTGFGTTSIDRLTFDRGTFGQGLLKLVSDPRLIRYHWIESFTISQNRLV